jgi:hypothetical protein
LTSTKSSLGSLGVKAWKRWRTRNLASPAPAKDFFVGDDEAVGA